MHPLVRIALRTARQAGKHVINAYDRPHASRLGKTALRSLIDQVRRNLDREFKDGIQTAFPDHKIVTEHSKSELMGNAPFTWTVLSLVGEVNFTHSLPGFCAAIGIYEGQTLQHSIVYDYVEDDEYHATLEEGARRNQNRSRVSSTTELREAVVALVEPEIPEQRSHLSVPDIDKHISSACKAVRKSGCPALDVARVSNGNYDLFVSHEVGIPSIEITSLLVSEAGGFIGSFLPNENSENQKIQIAGHPNLLQLALRSIRENCSESVS